MINIKEMTMDEMVNAFAAKHEGTADTIKKSLSDIMEKYGPDGFVLLECQDMCSSKMGHLTIVAFGPQNSLKEVPNKVMSPTVLS